LPHKTQLPHKTPNAVIKSPNAVILAQPESLYWFFALLPFLFVIPAGNLLLAFAVALPSSLPLPLPRR
jgi:hypothetical protein